MMKSSYVALAIAMVPMTLASSGNGTIGGCFLNESDPSDAQGVSQNHSNFVNHSDSDLPSVTNFLNSSSLPNSSTFWNSSGVRPNSTKATPFKPSASTNFVYTDGGHYAQAPIALLFACLFLFGLA